MGPQFYHCGNLLGERKENWNKYPLQWGRSSITAEMARFCAAARREERLQWGRSSITAEIHTPP